MLKVSTAASWRTPARRVLREVVREALGSCNARQAVLRNVGVGARRLNLCGRSLTLERKGRLLILAYGKAAGPMTEGLLDRVLEAGATRRVEGLVIGPGSLKPGRPAGGLRLTCLRGEHPVPGRGAFAAGRAALRLAAAARAGDDVVFLASGGGSSMMAAPLAPFLTRADKAQLHRALIGSGAPVEAINAVRKRFSALKGGRLAIAARRASSLTTLIVCDVDPERCDEVASGPSLPDRSTFDDMVLAIDRHGLAPLLPERALEAMRSGRLPDTPRAGIAAFRRARWEVVVSNRDLRAAAVRAGLSRGLPSEAVGTEMAGPVGDAVERLGRAVETAPSGTRLLVLGGEVTTVPVGRGRGGRAQEFALRLALRLSGLAVRPWTFLALGSDGIDGNSPAAGAIVDGASLDRARASRLDPRRQLGQSNSYGFFRRLGDEVLTGPTGTNVRDLYLLLTGEVRGIGAGGPGRLLTPTGPDR
ncbi:MAG: glycerate kinase [Acidobacteriota bacterium]